MGRFRSGWCAPRQLVLVGFFIHLGADSGHRLLNLGARSCDVGEQRAGERVVGAGLAIERGLLGPVANAISVPRRISFRQGLIPTERWG